MNVTDDVKDNKSKGYEGDVEQFKERMDKHCDHEYPTIDLKELFHSEIACTKCGKTFKELI